MGILEQLAATARQTPRAPALLHGGQAIGHAQLQALLHGAARGLRRQGLRAGETVGLCMRQTPLHCISLLALLRLGVLVVPIGTNLPPAERRARAAKYAIGRVLTDHEQGGIAGIESLMLGGLKAQEGDDGADLGPLPAPGTPARLALTSGTIGEPKAVLHSHEELRRRALRTIVDWDEAPRLLPPRLHLTVATAAMLGTLCRGGAVVFPDGEQFEHLIAAARDAAATHLILSPAAAMAVAAQLKHSLPALKQLRLVGGQPTPQQLALLRERITPQVRVTYALTELGPLALDGRVCDGVRLEVVDEHGQPCERGEIRVIADPMPTGYYHDAARTAERFREGWFHTGDLGGLSSDGLLRIEGRTDELFNFGGHKLLPQVLEQRLLQHPQVRQAAVFALPGPDGADQLGVALVADADPGTLAELCRQVLGLRDPSRLLLLNELPRNELGKVLRGELRRLAVARRP